MRRTITAYWLGRIGYDAAHRLQQKLVEARIAGRVGDVVLLLEHDAVITLSQNCEGGQHPRGRGRAFGPRYRPG